MEVTKTLGRRKTAVARLNMVPGKGNISVNGREFKEYFPSEILQIIVNQPFALTDQLGTYDLKVNVDGGGIKGQAEAIRLAISRALSGINLENRPALKKEGFLTRDPRMVERKKPGRRKARRKFQFSKRVHFGHLTRKWDPRMAPYIFMEKNGIHILDLNKTVTALEDAANAMKGIVRSGRKVMFVATKKQAQEIVSEEANRLKMPYVTDRWLGDVNKLRQMTGAGMMDCKKALMEANGDFEAAVDYLRKAGQKVAAKRADNATSEGLVMTNISADGTNGKLVAFACETEPVSKVADFQNLANTLMEIAVVKNPASIDDLLASHNTNGQPISESIIEFTAYENITAEKGDFEEEDTGWAEAREMEAQKLNNTLDKITTEEKSLILMKYQDDLSIKEIGEVMKLTESAVKMRLKRTKDK
ncbi:hypothetical protein B566_EDAN018643, partial [Ephemera danica]